MYYNNYTPVYCRHFSDQLMPWSHPFAMAMQRLYAHGFFFAAAEVNMGDPKKEYVKQSINLILSGCDWSDVRLFADDAG